MSKHHIIMIQGIGDNMLQMSRFARGWNTEKFQLHLHTAPWKIDKKNFPAKVKKLTDKIDFLTKNGDTVSLVGVSAGGSLALSAFAKRKKKIQRIILVASRLRKGNRLHAATFHFISRAHPAFADAVTAAEAIIPRLQKDDKEKIMTFRGLADELVPTTTSWIPGALNVRVPTMLHLVTHGATLLFYKRRILQFLEPSSLLEEKKI